MPWDKKGKQPAYMHNMRVYVGAMISSPHWGPRDHEFCGHSSPLWGPQLLSNHCPLPRYSMQPNDFLPTGPRDSRVYVAPRRQGLCSHFDSLPTPGHLPFGEGRSIVHYVRAYNPPTTTITKTPHLDPPPS